MATASREAITVFLSNVELIPSGRGGKANITVGGVADSTKGGDATVTRGGKDNSAATGKEHSPKFSGSMSLASLQYSYKSPSQCMIQFFPKKCLHFTRR